MLVLKRVLTLVLPVVAACSRHGALAFVSDDGAAHATAPVSAHEDAGAVGAGRSTAAASLGAGAAQPAQASDAATPARSAEPGLYARVCEAECSDELATVTTYRTASDDIGVVTVLGSPSACSHPPLRFFGADGAEKAVIPQVSVTPGSATEKRFDAIRRSQIGSLRKAETFLCRNVKH